MNINPKTIKPAKRYAQAFFEIIKDKNKEEILSELITFNNYIQNDEKAKTFFNHPAISHDEKKSALSSIQGEIKDFISVLIDSDRLNCLNEITSILQNKINDENGILPVDVISAIKLDDNKKAYIKERLDNKFKKDTIPTFFYDESILGGLIIKVNDTVIDLSIKKKLENFKVI